MHIDLTHMGVTLPFGLELEGTRYLYNPQVLLWETVKKVLNPDSIPNK